VIKALLLILLGCVLAAVPISFVLGALQLAVVGSGGPACLLGLLGLVLAFTLGRLDGRSVTR
jgi:hypothetical protein